ncbi:MAG TPA: class I adenylate-forming enzyme family protein [Acidimicrobiia bacterium]|nr:class I adenylate-forming enzyme family protein [Acidimicrobiia bacterium]
MAGAVAGRPGGPLAIDFSEPSWAERRRVFIRDRMKLNYANWVDRLVELYGDRTAFVLDRPIDYPGFSGDVISYRDLGRMVSQMAHALRELGVQRGDRVGMITANRIEMAFVNFAAGRIGAIPVPMNFMLRPSEIDYIMRKAGAEVLVCDDLVWQNTIRDASEVPSVKRWVVIGDQPPAEPCVAMRDLMVGAPERVEPVLPASDTDPALLFFTSGTTGFPKGAVLTHAAAMVGVRNHGRVYSMKPRLEPTLSLLVMPVAHAGGYAAMLLQLAMGTPAYFMSRFDAAGILDTIERYQITLFSGAPTMFRMMLDAGARDRDLTSIKIWGGGADLFSDELVGTFRNLAAKPGRLGRKRKPMFIRGYGMAEANSYVTQTPPFECGDACVGWVMPPVKFRIVDEHGRDVERGQPGELLLRGPNIIREYWNDPEATAAALHDGWLHTGDVLRQGKWRMLYFVARTKEIIKTGGYKVAAAEIDQILREHPDVQMAATVGVPDERKGEFPMAAVVLRDGATATTDEILEWARERIAPYKCPRRLFVLDEIPFTFSMKPKRLEVRERIVGMLEAERAGTD